MDPERTKFDQKVSSGIFTKDIFTKLFSNNLLKNILTVGYNAIIVALITLAYQLIMIRKLGPEDYGTLQTLLTINTIVLIAFSSIGLVVARFVSYYRTRQQYDNMRFLANKSFIVFFSIGFIAFVLNTLLSRQIANYLNISDNNITLFFGIVVWISFVVPIIDGILRGLQEFSYLGKYKVADAILRAVLASMFVFIGLGLDGVVWAIIAASTITTISAAYILRKIYINKPHRINFLQIYKFAIPVFITMICFAILSNIDLVLVKHFFDQKTTGMYAAAGILAKIVFSLTFGASGVLFPKIVEHYSNGEEDEIIKVLRNTIRMIIIPGALITLIIALFPVTLARFFFGKEYMIGGMLTIYALSMLFLSIAILFTMYNLAIKRYSYIPLLVIAATVMIYQISKLHDNLYDVVWTLFIINGLLMALFLIYNKKEIYLCFSRQKN